ncbi:hypothetical protein NDU88_000654 [Pleurodeles waltl]|uniref:Uncharacterized protein n=1 Tax=Pleurodeles waltl TaxID=8319 RepID=A0AAV7NBZ9_PLEWA|nr:hypothetical protein NDU88_000654 [Pleurodeles waltl]
MSCLPKAGSALRDPTRVHAAHNRRATKAGEPQLLSSRLKELKPLVGRELGRPGATWSRKQTWRAACAAPGVGCPAPGAEALAPGRSVSTKVSGDCRRERCAGVAGGLGARPARSRRLWPGREDCGAGRSTRTGFSWGLASPRNLDAPPWAEAGAEAAETPRALRGQSLTPVEIGEGTQGP